MDFGGEPDVYTYGQLAPVALVSYLVPASAFLDIVLDNIRKSSPTGPVQDLIKDTARILKSTHAPFDWEHNFSLLSGGYNGVFPELLQTADQTVSAVHGGVAFSRGCSVGLYKAGRAKDSQVYAVALVQMPMRLFKKWSKFAAMHLPDSDTNATLTDSDEPMQLHRDFVQAVFVDQMRADLARMLFDSGAYYIQTLLFSLNLAASPQSLVGNPYHRDSAYHSFALSSGYLRKQKGDGYTSGEGSALLLHDNPVHGLYLIQPAVGLSPFRNLNDAPTEIPTNEPANWERIEPAKADSSELALAWRRKEIINPLPNAVSLSPLAGIYCLSLPRFVQPIHQ